MSLGSRLRAAAGTAAGLVVTVALVGVPAGSADAAVHPAATAPKAAAPTVQYADGTPRNTRITIPSIGIHRLPVIAYRGKTDDGPGTKIQNKGIAASPYGRRGGTGPGAVGNYQVTAHRTSHGGVFGRVPSLRNGAKVIVDAGRWRYIYKVTRTRWVSFRSAASLRKQRAAVPGHPGRKPHKGYITVSTCATPEDHANGNYWTDRYGNPEHRIDKIGVLVKRVHNPHYGKRG